VVVRAFRARVAFDRDLFDMRVLFDRAGNLVQQTARLRPDRRFVVLEQNLFIVFPSR
jgi:hypothetical protein